MGILPEKEILNRIDRLVESYIKKEDLFNRTLHNLQGLISISQKLKPLIHTVKGRIKEPDHLRHKLIRKANKAKEENREFDITEENLSIKVNDLVGVRIIHLHTKQFESINQVLKEILREENWEIVEGPIAKTWDDEYRSYFSSIDGMKIENNKNMYTSVHYDVRANSRTTCEIQVRTLMEEVWGEVDHTINYPDPTESFSCREQIKALARSTSSCSRLVDSIFSTHSEFSSSKLKVSKKEVVKSAVKKVSKKARKKK